ncbi:MAG: glycosyltransferase, partial [Leptolyngbyaceae cyanobacterium SL_1_1]|nr:glycosyltransferase [Leptolyngbyaceae cyanobacterium SL_1_1]
NIFPVVSHTGFAPDIITHGQNGFLFKAGSSIEQIAYLIEEAFRNKTNVRKTVENLTWENFSKDINEILYSL